MIFSCLRFPLFFLLLSAMLFEVGCAGSTSQQTRTQFYVLNSIETTSPLVAGDAVPLSLEISSLRLPQYLEKPQLVTRTGSNKLKVAEYHQWGGSLRKDMMRILATNLSGLLATPHLAIYPSRFPGEPDFRVEIEVLRFEGDSDGNVHLSALWRLSKGRKKVPAASQLTTISQEVNGNLKNYEAIVSAMSSLYGELSQVIAKSIMRKK